MGSKEIAVNFTLGLWNDKNVSLCFSYMDKDVIVYTPLGNCKGFRAMEELASGWFESFPDFLIKIITTIAEGDFVAIQWKANATHKGTFRDIPATNRKIAFSGGLLYKIKNGKITEYSSYNNMISILKQITLQ